MLYSYDVPEVPPGLIEFEKSNILRALGNIALDMCFVADGTLDGIIDTRGLVSGYDIMASALVLKEAEGFLTNLEGGKLHRDVKASGLYVIGTKNKELHDKIVRILSPKTWYRLKVCEIQLQHISFQNHIVGEAVQSSMQVFTRKCLENWFLNIIAWKEK